MIKYVCLVKLRLESFTTWKLEYISRGLNERAYALVVVVASLIIKETVFPLSITGWPRQLLSTR